MKLPTSPEVFRWLGTTTIEMLAGRLTVLTFAPLPPDQSGPGSVVRPMWIDALFATALFMLIGTAFYMAYKTMSERQRKQA